MYFYCMMYCMLSSSVIVHYILLVVPVVSVSIKAQEHCFKVHFPRGEHYSQLYVNCCKIFSHPPFPFWVVLCVD